MRSICLSRAKIELNGQKAYADLIPCLCSTPPSQDIVRYVMHAASEPSRSCGCFNCSFIVVHLAFEPGIGQNGISVLFGRPFVAE